MLYVVKIKYSSKSHRSMKPKHNHTYVWNLNNVISDRQDIIIITFKSLDEFYGKYYLMSNFEMIYIPCPYK